MRSLRSVMAVIGALCLCVFPGSAAVLDVNGDAVVGPEEVLEIVRLWRETASSIGSGSASWNLTGNAGTEAGPHFLGTTDNEPLEFRVSGSRAMRILPNVTSPNIIAGYSGNVITPEVSGGTISGGGTVGEVNSVAGFFGTIGGGNSNSATDEFGTVGGGRYNRVMAPYGAIAGGGANSATDGNRVTDKYGFVGGGFANQAGDGGGTALDAWLSAVVGGADNRAGGEWSFVGGGLLNRANGSSSTIAGGNRNTASDTGAFVGGGYSNVASDFRSVVAGGFNNEASGRRSAIAGGYSNITSGEEAAIGGGYNNGASGSRSTVGGGRDNTAGGQYATVPGGFENSAAGDYNFAAGRSAQASHQGRLVLADSTGTDFPSVREDALRVRFNGGATFLVNDDQWARIWSNDNHLIDTSTGAYLSVGGAWENGSDRNAKENFSEVDAQEVLRNLAETPIRSWNYKAENTSIRHIGPVAQDFQDAFGVGASDKSIATVDADGVALAAIQALYELAQEKDERIAQLEARLSALERAEESAE